METHPKSRLCRPNPTLPLGRGLRRCSDLQVTLNTNKGQSGAEEPLWSSLRPKSLWIIACASVERTGTDLLRVGMTS